MKVAVIRGGRSSEHEISLESGASVSAGLREAGHETVEIVIERDGRWLAGGAEIELIPAGGLMGCAAAFPVLHGPGGEDGSVQGVLEVLDLPYVGSDVEASALCLDKLAFKRVLTSAGLPQVDFADAGAAPGDSGSDADSAWRTRVEALGLPLWVKPSRLGSSVGITKVESLDGLDEAVALARRHDPKVIVEANSPGKEVECSVLGHSELMVSVPGEIVTHADWYDYEAKYSEGGMDLRVPAEIPDASAQLLRDLAARIFRLCGCSGLARCDFFVEGEAVLVNELNTIPGFTTTSVYGKLLAAGGIAYPDLCDRLVMIALERHQDVRSYEF
ncbi:MAG TPA: D-alanine--D-alanine ligase family protein [Solirubrobacterales bacterium]|jgi:D-alanine-D-alanine ligase|nr:D-alanine--D-alanine ligase family protein [Solirubrobacterales bacterium]